MRGTEQSDLIARVAKHSRAPAAAVSSGFTAWLTAFRPFVEGSSTNPLIGYRWVETRFREDGTVEELPGGRRSDGQGSGVIASVTRHPYPPYENQAICQLTQPVDGGSVPGTPSGGMLSVNVQWSGAGAGDWVYGCCIGRQPEYSDIAYQEGAGLSMTVSLPTDNSLFYITIYWTDDNWNTYGCNVWAMRLEEQPEQFAIHLEEPTRIVLDDLPGPVGSAKWPKVGDDWEPITPVLVYLHPSTRRVQEGDSFVDRPQMVFTGAPEEFWGILSAPPAGYSQYTDERYWIARAHIVNGVAQERYALALASLTGAQSLCVTATNVTESRTHGHALAIGDVVRVRVARGGTYPHVPRYWFASGTPGVVAGITGTFHLVTKLCVDDYGCIYAWVDRWFRFSNGLLVEVETPVPECPE
jgi:hypothetical protein